MSLNGYDYAWGFTNSVPAALKNAGASFVVRYVGSSTKCLTGTELRLLHTAGLAVGMVWEVSGTDFTGGKGAGESDGSAARGAAESLGAPVGAMIWFAIDTDTSDYAACQAYLEGAALTCAPYTAGLYAGAHVIDKMPGSLHWQTYAWSGGELSAKAALYQHHNGVKVGGVDMDQNVTVGTGLAATGGWLVPSKAPVGPVQPPAPVPVPAPTPKPVTPPTVHIDALSAAKAEEAHPTQNWHDRCLVFVRTCFGLSADGREPTAASSWTDCPTGKRHPSADGKDAPPDVPFVFSGGSAGAGHIVVMKGDGHGGCYSSDWPNQDGKIGETTVAAILAAWGNLRAEGWMEELEGHVVYSTGTPPTPGPNPQPTPGPNGNPGFVNYPGGGAFKIGHADPAVWVLGVRLQAAGFAKHLSHGKSVYAPSHVFSFHDWLNVQLFQKAQGWSGANADGYPGPITWQKLGEASKWVV